MSWSGCAKISVLVHVDKTVNYGLQKARCEYYKMRSGTKTISPGSKKAAFVVTLFESLLQLLKVYLIDISQFGFFVLL